MVLIYNDYYYKQLDVYMIIIHRLDLDFGWLSDSEFFIYLTYPIIIYRLLWSGFSMIKNQDTVWTSLN